jgi:hypothetical protein
MREAELRKRAECSMCREKIGKGIAFYTIEAKRYIFDQVAMQRRHGLDLMMGNAALASVFSPDEELAVEMGASSLTLCMTCGEIPERSALEMALMDSQEVQP